MKAVPYMKDLYGKYFENEEELQNIKDLIIEENIPLIEIRMNGYESQCKDEPMTGEILRQKDGSLTRITKVWNDRVQTGGSISGSYHLYEDGLMSYSGGLDCGISKDRIKLTEDFEQAKCWHFDRDWATAHNSISYWIPVQVWQEV